MIIKSLYQLKTNKEETQVVALGRTVTEAEKKAQQRGWDPSELVFCGPKKLT